jgi:fatty-acyl-CoA synthase
MDLSSWISFWATWSPSRVALRLEGAEVSYAELDSCVAARASELLSGGVSDGERVAYLGPNRPELLELLFACSRIGAIFVPLNARMPPKELRAFTSQSEPRLLFAVRSRNAGGGVAKTRRRRPLVRPPGGVGRPYFFAASK